MKGKYKLYYGTEENCFECEKLADNVSREEAIEILKANIAEDIEEEGMTQDKFEETLNELLEEEKEKGYVAFTNAQDYQVAYVVTEDGRKGRAIINEIRKESLNFLYVY
jgi:uncharacterized FAD-dependent dehydrogenase